MSKKAIGLIRVSTDDQALGLDAQRAAIMAWASASGHVIAEWFVEDGVGGATPIDKREGLLDAIAALQVHKAKTLVVARRDRLARDTLNSLLIERMVKDAGAVILAASGEGNGDSPEDALMRTILAGIATWERARIAMRTRAALAVLKSQGKRTGKVRLGFVALEDGTLVRCQHAHDAAALVKRLRQRDLSWTQVVAEVNTAGFRTQPKKPGAVGGAFTVTSARRYAAL